MPEQEIKYKGKIVLFQSPLKLALKTLFCFSCALFFLFVEADEPKDVWLFGGLTVVFLLVGSFLLFTLLRPGYVCIAPSSELAKQLEAEAFEQSKKFPGQFKYTTSGFIFENEVEKVTSEWKEIQCIFARKRDVYAYDQFVLDIFLLDYTRICITENTPGWYLFIENMQTQFSGIDIAWQIRLMAPPLESPPVLLYDKDNRTEEDVKSSVLKSLPKDA